MQRETIGFLGFCCSPPFTMADSSPVPVLMITDIGRDPVDTVALLALLAYRPEFELVGVVTSGASERMRAALVMEWLDIVGCNDAVRGVGCWTGVLLVGVYARGGER